MLTLGERISDIERQNLSSLFCQEPKEIPKNSITHFHVTLFIFRYTIGKMKEEREKNVSNVVPSPERGGQYLNLSLFNRFHLIPLRGRNLLFSSSTVPSTFYLY